jgi:hypothetical protein
MSLLDDIRGQLLSLLGDNQKNSAASSNWRFRPKRLQSINGARGINAHPQKSIRKCEEQYLRVVNVDGIHKIIFVQRGKADERIHSAVSYFRKAIAICQAVGTVLFASHPSSPAMRKPLFPS